MSQIPSQGGQPNAAAALPREKLQSIAVKQRRLLVCILCYLVLVVCYLVLVGLCSASQTWPSGLITLIGLIRLGTLGVGVASAVFVFMLGIQLYGKAVGVLLGLLTFLPAVGLLIFALIVNAKAPLTSLLICSLLIFLLIVNAKATRTLRAGGLRVGLLGVNPSQFKIE